RVGRSGPRRHNDRRERLALWLWPRPRVDFADRAAQAEPGLPARQACRRSVSEVPVSDRYGVLMPMCAHAHATARARPKTQTDLGRSMPGNTLMTAESSSPPCPAVDAIINS